MRIESSEVAFSAAHTQTRSVQERIELRVSRPQALALADTVSLSERALSAGQIEAAEDEEGGAAPETSLIRLLVEQLIGQRIRVVNPRAAERRSEAADAAQARVAARETPIRRTGVEVTMQRSRVESEALAVAAQGVVRTADGREIRFELSLALSRRFAEQQTLSVRAGAEAPRKKDPLVINFDGNAAQLSGERIAFDLDADGVADDLPFVAAGSGLLVLDRNGDGRVNDGSELFGALSGDGFAELALHDSDANGWIDEADADFARLQLWTRDGGGDRLQGLAEAGVGAIYLGQIASAFGYRDGDNQPLAELRATGVFLKEDGGAGTVQQLDLYV